MDTTTTRFKKFTCDSRLVLLTVSARTRAPGGTQNERADVRALRVGAHCLVQL